MSDNTSNAQPYEFSEPVVFNPDFKRTIGDIKLFASLPLLERHPDMAAEFVPAVISLLERAIVGGIEHRPADEFWPLLEEVSKQMQAAGNPKNSAPGS